MDEIKEIKDNLKINEYLDLIQEDKNLSMGYVSLAQYIYILECRITNLQETCQNAINQSIIDHKYASKKEDEVIVLQEENNNLKFMNESLSREIELKKEVIELLQNN